MVSSTGWQLNSRKRITGFGCRKRTTRGRGVVRRAVGAIARPALSFIANKVADLISGSGRRRRTVRRRRVGGSYRITGAAVRRRAPRSRLTTRSRRTTGCGYKKRRAPRRTLVVRRRR
jgi:hypothetical protein